MKPGKNLGAKLDDAIDRMYSFEKALENALERNERTDSLQRHLTAAQEEVVRLTRLYKRMTQED